MFETIGAVVTATGFVVSIGLSKFWAAALSGADMNIYSDSYSGFTANCISQSSSTGSSKGTGIGTLICTYLFSG
jgi:hypothetical protein